MQLSSGYEHRRARIEIVPLLDVVFLLLVFFIYAMVSMTVHRGLRVQLPTGAGSPESVDSFIITLSAENGFLIEDEPVNMDEAVGRAYAHAGDGTGKVLIYGDRDADLGPAIELLSRLRTEGVEAVSFVVEKASKPPE